jgi:rubrerythrin
MRIIEKQPTADVVEVKHSRIKWVNRPISAQYVTVTDEYGEKHYGKVCDTILNNPVGYCGECGKRLDDTFMNYCPNCGAKMDGERSENENNL